MVRRSTAILLTIALLVPFSLLVGCDDGGGSDGRAEPGTGMITEPAEAANEKIDELNADIEERTGEYDDE